MHTFSQVISASC